MQTKTQKLMEWAIHKIKTEYPQDVALLVGVEGHSVNDDGHGECFDYFIPATERGYELSQTFIIDGIGHDLYPRSWERMERTAALDDRATLCIGTAKILYSRSQEDEARFYAIQKKFYDNLSNPRYTYGKALENLEIAMNLYRSMLFEDAIYKLRMEAGYVHHYLSMAVTYLNGTFLKDWRKGRISELIALKQLPCNFVEYYQAILTAKSPEELKSLAHLSIATTRRFIAAERPAQELEQPKADYKELANWYQELSLTWRRIRYYCEVGNADAAYIDACNLQSELGIVGEEFGLREMDLLGAFDGDHLHLLSQRATELEDYIVTEIVNHGVALKKYDTLEEFLANNQ